jgi:pentatricopeptide repeat protein
LGLRVALIWTTRDDPIFAVPMLDAEYAVEWARSVRAGDVFGSPEGTAYFRTPLYAWLLALAALLPGDDLAGARLLQAGLGATAAALLASIAGRRFGRAAGLVTGGLAVASWPLLFFARELLIASLSVFWGALLLRVQDGAGETSRARRWLAIGAIVGLGAATRPNFLILAPVAIALAFMRAGKPRRWAATALVAGGALLVVAPITVRNRIVSGEWVLLSYQGGLNLWIGNNPDADGMSARLPGFSSWRNEDVEAQLAREAGRAVGPSEQDAYFRRQAIAFFSAEPLRAAALLVRKTYLLAQGYEIRNNRDLYAMRERDVILGLPGPDFGWIGPLALVGFFLAWRRRAELAHLWGFAAAMSASIVLFFVCSRYRLPLWPPMLVYSGVTAATLFAPTTPLRPRVTAAVLLVGCVVLARVDFLGIRSPDRSQVHYQYGNVYARVGRDADAERQFREALDLAPTFAEARHHLGALLLRQGRVAEALPELKSATEALPLSFRARRSLAEALTATGAFEAAVAARREIARLSAGDPRDLLLLADALGASRRYEEAWALYRELRSAGMEDPFLDLNGGQTALALGHSDEGREWIERAIAHPETRVSAYEQLGRYLLANRRAEEALGLANEAIAFVPGRPELHRLRAYARHAVADTAGAIADFETVLALDPNDVTSRRRLAILREAGGP